MDSALYTCLITINRAVNVPVSDVNNFSCDPYFHATLSTGHGDGSSDTHSLTYRTHTVRRTRDPSFDSQWLVSGIPASGFTLSLTLFDEDPGNFDDKLGKAVLHFPENGLSLDDGWESKQQEYKVHKRKGVLSSKLWTFVAKVATRGKVGHRCRVWVSVQVVGKADDQKDRRLYTLGPRTSNPLKCSRLVCKLTEA